MHKVILSLLGVALLTGCATKSREMPFEPIAASPQPEVHFISPPGVVEYVWEEPMVDVVEVPPGLDPEGHYYRPAHQEIVEIRQGRWKHYRGTEERQENNTGE